MSESATSLSPLKRFLVFWMPVVAICTIIFVQSSYPTPHMLPKWPYRDKLLHAAVYGLLAFCLARSFNSHTLWRHRYMALWCLSVVAATLYGVSDEWHQSFVKARTTDVLDVAADGIGAAMGAWIYLRFILRPVKKPSRH